MEKILPSPKRKVDHGENKDIVTFWTGNRGCRAQVKVPGSILDDKTAGKKKDEGTHPRIGSWFNEKHVA